LVVESVENLIRWRHGPRRLPITKFTHKTAVVTDERGCACIVLAARDMPAERRRAAALDRSHHFHLVETDVAAVGLTPSGTVVAKDLRDLQHRMRQGRGLVRWRPAFLLALAV
jgi:hypothetical protein